MKENEAIPDEKVSIFIGKICRSFDGKLFLWLLKKN